MITIKSTKILYVDVDNTLVFSLTEPNGFNASSNEMVKINGRKWWVHTPHKELIKDFKARGHTVIIWSAGGAEWAEMVTDALQLNDYIDLVISKPDWIIDDKPTIEWLGEDRRFYKGHDGYAEKDIGKTD
jgi:hypothetical protein